MANFSNYFGFCFTEKNKHLLEDFIKMIAINGKHIYGYHGHPYSNFYFEDAKFVLRMLVDKEKGELGTLGTDNQTTGNSIWNVKVSIMDVNPKDADILQKRCAVTKIDGNGLAIVNIINADILPNFLPETELKLQMTAFPIHIEYFQNEEQYRENFDANERLFADGTVSPALFLNRNIDDSELIERSVIDSINYVKGKVIAIDNKEVKIDDKLLDKYLSVIVDTDFGELEIMQPTDSLKDEQKEKIKIGATVYGLFYLSGDAAISEYKDGIIFDETHHLELLRGIYSGEDVNRLNYVIEDNTKYRFLSNEEYVGKENIIKNIEKYINNNLCVQKGIITDENLYNKQCLIISEKENYKYLLFLDVFENGRIKEINIVNSSEYSFEIL